MKLRGFLALTAIFVCAVSHAEQSVRIPNDGVSNLAADADGNQYLLSVSYGSKDPAAGIGLPSLVIQRINADGTDGWSQLFVPPNYAYPSAGGIAVANGIVYAAGW